MKTLFILLTLTLLTGWVSAKGEAIWSSQSLIPIIMGIGIIKFLLVAFNFMELKNAHIFWKSSIIIFAIIFLTTITIISR